MAKPVLNNVGVFDALLPREFTFEYDGGYVVGSTLTVRKNEDNSVVYQQYAESMLLKHTLPANILTNGMYYTAEISVRYRDVSLNEFDSPVSSVVPFRCMKTPTITLIGLTNGMVVKASSFSVNAQYEQAQSDALNEFIVRIYELTTHKLVYDSGSIYTDDASVPLVFAHTVSNLLDNTECQLVVSGISVSGMAVQSAVISFQVRYSNPSNYQRFYIANVPETGMIRIDSNFNMIDGTYSSDDPPVFVDGTAIDLTGGQSVSFNDNLKLPKSYVLYMTFWKAQAQKTILQIRSDVSTLEVSYMKGLLYGETEEKIYLYLRQTSTGVTATCISNLISIPADDDKLMMTLVFDGGLVSIRLEVIR